MITAKLTTRELKKLVRCESIIAKAQKLRLLEAKALLVIREKRLYRESHETFEDYCRERWGFSLAHGKRLCGWAEVAHNVAPIGAVPGRESHARPLALLQPDQQREVWSEYLRTCEDVHSASRIEQVCRDIQNGASMAGFVTQPPYDQALSPPISWYGSKTLLAPRIVRLFPPHQTYVEPFAGSCAVLFAKPPSEVEIINDLDGDVVNLFRVLRDSSQSRLLHEALLLTPYARDEHDWCREHPTAGEPVEQARRFFVRCRQSYAGAVDDSWSHAVSKNRAVEFSRPVEQLQMITARLRNVQIENVDFRNLLKKCDRSGVLIYADPPYLQATRSKPNRYQHEMAADDHIDLLETLASFKKAKVILSGYRSRLYSQHLQNWRPIEFEVAVNSASSDSTGKKPRRTEVVWMNF